MKPLHASAFALPPRLAAKAAPGLVADDDEHFRTLAESLGQSVVDLEARLGLALAERPRSGQEAMDRDLEVQRISARLGVLRRVGLDLCLGHVVRSEDPEPLYVGRLGLTDRTGRPLLVDWRSPAAEPFFGATHANPMGLVRRRRYRWTDGRISDYWDEVFTPDDVDRQAALDDQSAFIASLGATRSPRMRDVLGTIQADQDAIIRAGSRGALVVDGGPGTGKTVVALHRTAYLLYSDPRLGHRHGGVLFVGPHQPYLSYVADVLPSLGEEGVRICTLRDLVPEGASAAAEPDPDVARLKSSAAMVQALDKAVAFYEEPPTDAIEVATHWGDVEVGPADWAEAFDSAEPGATHNEARDQVWDALVGIVADRLGEEVPVEQVRRSVAQDADLVAAFNGSWPLLEATDVVGDLWRVPAYLRLCAPWLTRDEVALLQRDRPSAWTVPDLPLIDAARLRLGDPGAARRERREEAEAEFLRGQMDLVVDELLQADDDGMFAQLRQEGIRDALEGRTDEARGDLDPLVGPFAHVVVDEAQELTDAEWQMLLARCSSRSLTIVGDRAQARHGFTESWVERLARVGLDRAEVATLSINYRTPAEVMAEAEPVIRSVLPDANVPTSVRSTGVPVVYGDDHELDGIVDAWLAENAEGVAAVIGDPSFPSTPRVRSLSPTLAKGLEFDLVVLVEPDSFGDGHEGAVDRYVAMTRATQRLVILERGTRVDAT